MGELMEPSVFFNTDEKDLKLIEHYQLEDQKLKEKR